MRTVILLCMLALPACAQTPMPAPTRVVGAAGELAGFAWLAGSWSSHEKNKLVEEHWTVPSTNLMLGINRTVSDGTTRHHEQLRIEARPDGIFYVASPSGQDTAAFKLVEKGPTYAVFENLDHDYPKRITYRRSGRSLKVRIEGDRGDRVAEWSWQRTVLPYE